MANSIGETGSHRACSSVTAFVGDTDQWENAMSDALQTAAEARLALDLSRRKHFRLECSINTQFEAADADLSGQIIVKNLGLGGARVDAPVELPMPCVMQITLPSQGSGTDPQPELKLECQVAWTVADRAEGPFPTGIQFTDIDDTKKQSLFRYLAAVMR